MALAEVIRAAINDRIFQHANGTLIGVDLAISDIENALQGWQLVPVDPTAGMLQPACDGHTPGEPMRADRAGPDSYFGEECPRFKARRRIWASMTALSPPFGEVAAR